MHGDSTEKRGALPVDRRLEEQTRTAGCIDRIAFEPDQRGQEGELNNAGLSAREWVEVPGVPRGNGAVARASSTIAQLKGEDGRVACAQRRCPS